MTSSTTTFFNFAFASYSARDISGAFASTLSNGGGGPDGLLGTPHSAGGAGADADDTSPPELALPATTEEFWEARRYSRPVALATLTGLGDGAEAKS